MVEDKHNVIFYDLLPINLAPKNQSANRNNSTSIDTSNQSMAKGQEHPEVQSDIVIIENKSLYRSKTKKMGSRTQHDSVAS